MRALASICMCLCTISAGQQAFWVVGFLFKSRPDKRGAGPDAALGSVGLGVFSRLVTFPAIFLTAGLLLTDDS